MPAGWQFLGEGSFNKAYRSADGALVLKIPKESTETDSPDRSVRLWNEINPNLQPPARIEYTSEGCGWVCPYVEGKQASDEEMGTALIAIFNRTGRIVVDAIAEKNFVRTQAPNNQVICVDIGMALQLERREEVYFNNCQRRKSIVSLNAWQDLNQLYTGFFNAYSKAYPETVAIVKALVFIKDHRPDIHDVDFLKKNPDVVKKLAKAYDTNDTKKAISHLDRITPKTKHEKLSPPKHSIIEVGKDLLNQQCPLTLEHIKESLQSELERYIRSRGKINKQGIFEPSLITKIFRDKIKTINQVKIAKQLIDTIGKTSSFDALKNTVHTQWTSSKIPTSGFSSGFAAALGKCVLITESVKNNPHLKIEEQHRQEPPTRSNQI